MNNYWHPMNLPKADGFISVEKAAGANLTDQQGRTYLDGYSGLWNVNLGFNLPEINQAVMNQLSQAAYVNPMITTYDLIEQLSAKLIDLTGTQMGQVVYTCSGSESNELALKVARKYASLRVDKRQKIAVFDQSYHGSYYGSLSLSCFEKDFKVGYGPFVPDIVTLPSPCLESISPSAFTSLLEDLAHDCCAVFIEPILGSAGVWPMTKEQAQVIHHFCQTHDVLLIVDEVATGFCRTGSWFYYQQLGLVPDLICLSKGINNGTIPMGAVCVSQAIANAFQDNEQILFHLSTQNGNGLAVASALATISWLVDNDGLARVKFLSQVFSEQLDKTLSGLKSVADIRQVGLMIGIDIVEPSTGKPLSLKQINQLVSKIIRAGLLCGCGHVPNRSATIILMPPFIMKQSQVNKLMRILVSCLA